MVSYWKTQWCRFVIGCVYMLIAFHYLFTRNDWTFAVWLIGSFILFISADLSWHRDCLKAMDERIKALEIQAITNIDKVSNNNYMVRRRLGPDKDVPYPEEE